MTTISSLVQVRLIVFSLMIHSATSEIFSFEAKNVPPTGQDITEKAFENNRNVLPAAYGDFNQDKYIDMIAVDEARNVITVYFANNKVPFLRKGPSFNFTENMNITGPITSVIMGDFHGKGHVNLMVSVLNIETEKMCEKCSARCSNGTNSTITAIFEYFVIEVIFCVWADNNIKCSRSDLRRLAQEPMAVDLNGDMILDLVGETANLENVPTIDDVEYPLTGFPKTVCKFDDYRKVKNYTVNTVKTVWISEVNQPATISLTSAFHHESLFPMAHPYSNAFVDVEGLLAPDIVLVTKYDQKFFREVYEVSYNQGKSNLTLTLSSSHNISDKIINVVGQPIFMDLERNGQLVHLIPFCFSKKCTGNEWGFLVKMRTGEFFEMQLGPINYNGQEWNFISPVVLEEYTENVKFENITNPESDNTFTNDKLIGNLYQRSLVMSVGDFNLDGFPDLLAVLTSKNHSKRAVIFENVPCQNSETCRCSRTFQHNFELLQQYDNVISASFFDFMEDGHMGVVLVQELQNGSAHSTGKASYALKAFQIRPNVDSSFIKAMTLSGRSDTGEAPYGNLIPGALLQYHMKDVLGHPQTSIASQGYRSGYITLDTPYIIFGIGQSPNFVNHLETYLGYRTFPNSTPVIYKHDAHQIIPNSHIVFFPPYPLNGKWKTMLFLTPGHAVLQTFGVLVGILLVVGTLACGLEYKERREDRKEKMDEARRFIL